MPDLTTDRRWTLDQGTEGAPNPLAHFAHCEHDIKCERILALHDAVRCRWTCRKCGFNGIVDFPFEPRLSSYRPPPQDLPNVPPSFVVALSLAVLQALREQTDRERELEGARAVERYKRQQEELLHAEYTERMAGRPSVVYVIRNERSGAIKIGVSCDPKKRLTALKTANSDPLTIIATLPDGDEQRLHQRFAESRGQGEWFHPTPDLLAWIEEVRNV